MSIICCICNCSIIITCRKQPHLSCPKHTRRGRVGSSRWLNSSLATYTLSERQNQSITISVGGRKLESYTDAIARKVLPSSSNVNFVQLDVDGDDVSVLSETLRQWKEKAKHEDTPNNLQCCLVVNTAGPFQGRRNPTLLSSCIDLHIPYVDVCDEWELALTSKVDIPKQSTRVYRV